MTNFTFIAGVSTGKLRPLTAESCHYINSISSFRQPVNSPVITLPEITIYTCKVCAKNSHFPVKFPAIINDKKSTTRS
ncbi:hypothetical protein C5Y41_13970 [Rahnella variigena]|nr:hypothetical protein C5Y41_13970 [Rahnella variigena]